jgi:hypothetical protein
MNPIEPDRLIPLSTGTPGLSSTLHVEISKPPTADRDTSRGAASDPSTINSNNHQPVLDFVSSDETLDRYSEVISASGWQLANYQRNPVFQNAHQYGDILFTLGRALITEVRQRGQSSSSSSSGPVLYQRIEFATAVNPMARIAYGLYEGKFLNAVSVGFVPVRWVDGNGKEYSTKSSSSSSFSSNSELLVDRQSGLGPSAAQALDSRPSTLDSGQRSAGGFRRKYLEQELLEVSAVGIPANPNALALAYKSGAVDKSDLRDTFELLRLTLERAVAPAADTLSAGGEGKGEVVPPSISQPSSINPQLVRLAQSLYNTLRKI